jgi:pilus assembly protein CpaF
MTGGTAMDYRGFNADFSVKESETYQDVKFRLHHYLIDRIDVERVSVQDMTKSELSDYVLDKVSHYVNEHRMPISRHEMENLAREMVDELTGYGPLEELIKDDRINDILVNGTRHIYVERSGVLSRTDLRFIDDEHVLRVIRRILAPLGRRIDESSPMVDARLAVGSTPSSRRWRLTALACPSANSARTRFRPETWSPQAPWTKPSWPF